MTEAEGVFSLEFSYASALLADSRILADRIRDLTGIGYSIREARGHGSNTNHGIIQDYSILFEPGSL